MADGVEIRLTGLDGVLATLRSLPPELVSKRGGPVKQALRKGAVVILKEELRNLDRVIANQSAEAEKYSTGLLKKNVVVTRGKPPTTGKGERYLVRIRRKGYGRKGKPVTTLKTGQILEYGSENQRAEPWIRPAFKAKARDAISTIETEMVKSLNRVVARLAQLNKRR